MKNYYKISFLFFLIVLVACSSVDEEKVVNAIENPKKYVPIKYAEGFVIEEKLDYKVITLNGAWRGDDNTYQYVLYKEEKPEGYPNAAFIKIPIQTIACMSLTHVAFIEALNQINSIVALSGCDYVSSKAVKKRIRKGKIREAGQYQSFNYELLLEESPDIFMVFGINESSSSRINKLNELGLTAVLNGEHMEPHPLGKTEWIKFMGAFYDLDKEAEKFFNQIEREYLSLIDLTKNIKNKPSVFVGLPFKGAWYVPGGATFVSKFFIDAGANYLWGEDNEKGSTIKNKEVVLDEAYYTEFWLNQSGIKSMSEITDVDKKFSHFKAFKKGNVFNNNKRLNVNGGNDYWESGVINPHIILKDLIEIFHPELIEHELYYYQKLN